MIKDILLPDLGEGIEGAEVSEVAVAPGDTITAEDTILVLESDKASMEIPAEVNGTVTEIAVAAGDEVKTGQILIKIEISDSTDAIMEEPVLSEETDQIATSPEKEKPPEVTLYPVIEDTSSTEKVFASPGVRRLARELGINLQIIKGSGPKRRVTKDDLNGYIKLQMAMSAGSIPAPQPVIDFSQWGDVEVQKRTKIKRITGERLQQAWQLIPHVTQFDAADITDLDSLRKEVKKAGAEKGIKVTFLPFLMKALSVVLKEMPEFNSSLDHNNENLVLKNYYHLGVAVDTPRGLTVPVVRDVDQKSVFELSDELMDLSSRARDKKLKPNELKGGTFTISSLGGIGGTGFSPIVNPPEVAIMGVSRSAWKEVYDKVSREFVAKFIMPFSLSYDHRVIDGAAAAAFTSRFADVLSDLDHFKD
ncbi:Dihydrolipoamide acetyltransferase component of pyruvate dehydrogenase complex [hydrothermal vent metagenome]|jgi:pyruvate dehydrogenase E2 component (dihydrolipoamide acetyltransferase)|uniref:Dihydrolipoyllysine-residue acetyltransferase component of pyruvate dehydrogenase complex n=1 Tax=hydrothermal vent metagenome TaxID=652676 RepID=A0A161KGM5_9ZZZZ